MWPFSKPEYHVLVLCTANICRSPVAAALLSLHLKDQGLGRRVAVLSAGTDATAGAAADPRMVALAEQRGIKLRRHRSQGVDDDLLSRTNLILGMEQAHLDAVIARSPVHADVCELLDRQGSEVSDPYYGSRADVREAFERIDALCLDRASDLRLRLGS